jgi:hypothetical protein
MNEMSQLALVLVFAGGMSIVGQLHIPEAGHRRICLSFKRLQHHKLKNQTTIPTCGSGTGGFR